MVKIYKRGNKVHLYFTAKEYFDEIKAKKSERGYIECVDIERHYIKKAIEYVGFERGLYLCGGVSINGESQEDGFDVNDPNLHLEIVYHISKLKLLTGEEIVSNLFNEGDEPWVICLENSGFKLVFDSGHIFQEDRRKEAAKKIKALSSKWTERKYVITHLHGGYGYFAIKIWADERKPEEHGKTEKIEKTSKKNF